ncbi:MAG TPA: phenylalanine--tRNA ligase subunit beta, partial [Candidatus Competibacter sp.]|nr:phenylalanine--tRNA ligase subunit beta [Candidatus Competibacter sp.]
MKVSERWLRTWVDPAISTPELVAQLTMAGLEVDSVSPAAPPFEKVVVGRVIDLNPHPDADRLRVALGAVGGPEPPPIACRA